MFPEAPPQGGLPDCPECVHAVYAANKEYLLPLLASMQSAFSNSKKEYGEGLPPDRFANTLLCFHLIMDIEEIPILADALVQFLPTVPIELVAFNPEYVRESVHVWEGRKEISNPFNFARFFMPSLFPWLDVIVYLDPDTIIQTNLRELVDFFVNPTNVFSLEQEKIILAAVPSNSHTETSGRLCKLLNCSDASVAGRIRNPQKPYFNAGVFVTTLQAWRQNNVTEQIQYWLAQNAQRPLWKWGSQAPLCLVFYDQWIQLPVDWNFRAFSILWTQWSSIPESRGNISDIFDYIRSRRILHFTGDMKPWRENQLSVFWCPYYPRVKSARFPVLPFCGDSAPSDINPYLLPASPYDYSSLFKLVASFRIRLVLPDYLRILLQPSRFR